MTVRTTDRRSASRGAAAHPVAVFDRGGRPLLRGRTANVSQAGLLLLTEARQALGLKGRLVFQISLPAGGAGRSRRDIRTVRYLGRITRIEEIGQLIGMGVEFIEKLR